MPYHTNAGLLAQDRDFLQGLDDFARRLEANVPDLSRGERQLLGDVKRKEGRYLFRTLRKLNALARRSAQAEDHETMAELVRADGQRHGHTISLDDLFDAETQAQAECDIAQRRYARTKGCPAARAALIEAGQRQLNLTRGMLDQLYAEAR